MSRFKTYAVVCEETGEVISQFLEDMSYGQQVKKNGLTLIISEGEKRTVKKVRLSSNKGDMSKITSTFEPPLCRHDIYGRNSDDLIQIIN